MVEEIIKELLFEHDCVIIPEFGGFITNYASADIHPVKHSFLPPHKRVAFNERLKTNDGLLINEISVKKEITKEEAAEEVKFFVKEITDTLEEQKQVLIEGIGKFYFNEEQNIQFEPDNKENYLDDSFGLPELHFKPIEREEDDNSMKRVHPAQSRQAVRRAPARRKPADPKKAKEAKAKKGAEGGDGEKKKSKTPIIIIAGVVLVLVGAFLALRFIEDGKYYNSMMAKIGVGGDHAEHGDVHEASMDPSHEDHDAHAADGHAEDHHGDDHDDDDDAMLAADDDHGSDSHGAISTEGMRFHVIGGVFSVEQYAKRLKRKSRQGEILEIDGYYKVSVAQFDSEAEAEAGLDGLKGRYGSDIWILPHE